MNRLLLIVGSYLVVQSAVGAEVPSPRSAVKESGLPELEAANFIDHLVFAELRQVGMVPSRLSDDTTFLRRLTLTTIGQLPTADEVRNFVADDRPDKRARKIDELLGHELHAAVWATRFSELTGNSIETLEGPDELKPKRAKMWHDWLHARFAENVPYDDIVRGILTATSREGSDVDEWIDSEAQLVYTARDSFSARYADRATLDLFWRRDDVDNMYPVEQLAERIASSFMGIRINCARCHDHPFDPWTQQDYQDFAEVFSQVRFDVSPELRARFSDRLTQRRRMVAQGKEVGNALPRLREVYLMGRPQSGDTARAPTPLGGPSLTDVEVADYRVALMNWLNEPQNPYFARNLVNRVWAHHFGRGIVEPLDGLSSGNESAHLNSLDELAVDFVDHGYDLRRLERLILNSVTWQLSAEPNDTNQVDQFYFSRAYVRLPPPETIVDMWTGATGVASGFGDAVPSGVHAVEIGPSRFEDDRWNRFLNLFGRSVRTETCDCAPAPGPTIRQTLALMSDPNLLADLSNGSLQSWLATDRADDEILDELFLRTLSRWPTDAERSAVVEAIAGSEDRCRVFTDVLWGLLNCQEFITNQ